MPSGLGCSPSWLKPVSGEGAVLGPGPRGHEADRRRFELVHRSGHTVSAEAVVFATGFGAGRCVGGFIHDPGEQGRSEAESARADVQDALTGLPNRARFAGQLARVLAAAGGVPGTVAVVILDLDRFRAINNTMGHDAGDLVLVAVAERLKLVAGDAELIARFGGDEFLALFQCADGGAASQASTFIEHVRGALAEPFEVAGAEVFLDQSFGVALNTFGVDDPAELMSNAEAAMYQAKYREDRAPRPSASRCASRCSIG